MQIIRHALPLLIGGFLIVFGMLKFTGGAHIFPYIEYKAAALGLPFSGLFFPLVNWAVGALEIAAGTLIIAPMTRKIGSLAALLPFTGAVGFHLSPLLGVTTPNGYSETFSAAVLAKGGPFGAADFSSDASMSLFLIAAAMLALALANVGVQRR